MKYDVYFHNDFDGRASTALMLAFLRSRGDTIEHYVPMNYEILSEWLDEDFFKKHKLFRGTRNPAIVVDFLYHPNAAFWFDHHPTTFKKEAWQKKFRQSKSHHYDPSARSACRVVYSALKKDFGWKPPRHLTELAKWLDLIDGAQYRSARQTVLMKEPALQANNYIEENAGAPRITEWSIRFLSERPLKDYVKQAQVAKGVREIRKNTNAALDFYRNHSKIVGSVMVMELLPGRFSESVHYAPYYLHPKLIYAIRFRKQNKFYHLNVSSNPWRKKENHAHIGEILKRYGGGGHKGVGGLELKTLAEVGRVIDEIIPILNRS